MNMDSINTNNTDDEEIRRCTSQCGAYFHGICWKKCIIGQLKGDGGGEIIGNDFFIKCPHCRQIEWKIEHGASLMESRSDVNAPYGSFSAHLRVWNSRNFRNDREESRRARRQRLLIVLCCLLLIVVGAFAGAIYGMKTN